jgi:hypothetical protein
VEAGAAPRPSTADGPDPRAACTRRAHALGQVLRVAANASDKTSGGLQPHLLITMTLDSLRTDLATAGVPLGSPSSRLGGPHGGEAVAAAHPALFGGGDGGTASSKGTGVNGGGSGTASDASGPGAAAAAPTAAPAATTATARAATAAAASA